MKPSTPFDKHKPRVPENLSDAIKIMTEQLKDNLIFYISDEKKEYWANNEFRQFEIYNFTRAIKLSAEQVGPLLHYLGNDYKDGVDQSVLEFAIGEVIFKDRDSALPTKYVKNYPVEKNIWPEAVKLDSVDDKLKLDLEKNIISKLEYFKKLLDLAGIKYKKISEYSSYKDQHSIPETWEFENPLEIKIRDILPMFDKKNPEIVKSIGRSIGMREERIELLKIDDYVRFTKYPKVDLDDEIKRILSDYEFSEYKKNPYNEDWIFEFKCRSTI